MPNCAISFACKDAVTAKKEVKNTQRWSDMTGSTEAVGNNKAKKNKFFSRTFNPWAKQNHM